MGTAVGGLAVGGLTVGLTVGFSVGDGSAVGDGGTGVDVGGIGVKVGLTVLVLVGATVACARKVSVRWQPSAPMQNTKPSASRMPHCFICIRFQSPCKLGEEQSALSTE